jgi:hypothetical protein
MSEVDQLRAELRDVRYLNEAILMALVGKKKMVMYRIEARIESTFERERIGTPLRGLVKGPAYDALTLSYRDGLDLVTLEEVARTPREKIAELGGVGTKTMRKLEAAMADEGLTWAEAG